MIWAALLLALAQEKASPDRIQVRAHQGELQGEDPAFDRLQAIAEQLDGELEVLIPWLEAWTDQALPPGETLQLHLYLDIEAYRKTLKDSGVHRFLDTGAVTLWKSSESHLVVQPRATPEYLAAVGGVPELTLQLALHEVAHQFIERSGAFPTNFQPLWYSEGLAESLSLRALARMRPDALLPADSIGMLFENRADLLPLGELFVDAFRYAGLHRRGLAYAQCASLFAFLDDPANEPWATRFDEFELRLNKWPRPTLRSRPNWSRKRLNIMLHKVLIETSRLEAAWLAELEDPHDWRQIERSAEWNDDLLVVGSFSWGTRALAFAPEPLAKLNLGFEFQFLDATEHMFVALGGARQTRLELQVRSTGEVVLLAKYGDEYRVLSGVATELGDTKDWHSLALSGGEGELRVTLDGNALFDVRPPAEIPLIGRRWGVGTANGAARFAGLARSSWRSSLEKDNIPARDQDDAQMKR